jgi:hypothetical protein
MKLCRIATLIPALAGIMAASQVSAAPDLPYVELPVDRPLSSSCEAIINDAAHLLPGAMACQVDSDCDHYPCTCSAIGTNAAGQTYRALVALLQHDCGASVVYAYCGSTTPVCENGTCSTQAAIASSEETDDASKNTESADAEAPDIRFLPPDHAPRAFSFVTRTASIPSEVRSAFSNLCRDCAFPEFGPRLDDTNSANPDARRLLEAGESGRRWALRYEHGGACIHEHWVVVEI